MKTLVIGASEKPDRYAYKAINLLREYKHEVIAIGNRPGRVADVNFETSQTPFEGVDTVTLYINPKIQEQYYNYIVSLIPRRVIFNPGTENSEFEVLLQQNNIEVVIACTLVLLNTAQY